MNRKICYISLILLIIGLSFTLLASCGATTAISLGVNTQTQGKRLELPLTSNAQDDPDVELDAKLDQFKQYLADMKRELAIPGMSAAIVKDQKLIWAQGFGYADVEAGRPATPDTPYEIASLTKTLSSAILLQLVEQGRVNLDDPVSKFGIHIRSPGVIRVKHLLGMSSLVGDPGSVFIYSGARYGYLQKVIERASGRSFTSLLTDVILNHLNMSDSIPIDMLGQPAHTQIKDKLSKPYGMDQTYVERLSTAAGLISTALDLAKFDIALDQGQLIDPKTKAQAFTSQTLSSGDPPVYGLGWFVQEFQGTKMVWAFGYDAFSHLYLKFVDQGYTLIILTNSTSFGDYLSPRDRNVMRFPAALEFYKLFIQNMELSDMIDWDANEDVIAAQLQAAQEAGTSEIARQEIFNRYVKYFNQYMTAEAQKSLDTYTHFFATSEPPSFTIQPPFAKIDRVGNGTYSILEFTLEQDALVNIYAVGEYYRGQMVDYGGIEDVSSRELIWVMPPARTEPAGGCAVNRQAIDQINLQAGKYRLHYRTNNWGHSFGYWDAPPPDSLFWGIALYSSEGNIKVATSSVVTTPKDELLPRMLEMTHTRVVSNLEYGILWTCIGIMISVLVIIPVILWRKKDRAGTTKRTWVWTKVAAWMAWSNSLLCSLHLFVTMIINGLEPTIEDPIVLVSNSNIKEITFIGTSYVCIILAIFQVVFTILAWQGKRQSLAERIYYSFATMAVLGYLLLLSIWGLIAVPY